MRGRTGLIALVIASAAMWLSFTNAATASRVVTWKIPSRFVDPSTVTVNRTPFDPFGPLPPPGFAPDALRARVFLPDGYDRSSRRYPVLYLLHGIGDDYASWSTPGEGDLMRIAGDLRAVVVMPEGDRGAYVNWWNGGRRGDPAWERYFFEEVIPLVHKRLRIRAGRRWHAIAGLSMGGLGSIFWASQRPGYFGTAASFSGLLSVTGPEVRALGPLFDIDIDRLAGDPVEQEFYVRGHDPVTLARNLRRTRVYVTAGDGTPRPGDRASTWTVSVEHLARSFLELFVAAADRAEVRVKQVVRRGVHDWASFRHDLQALIRWGLFRRVKRRPTHWTYKTVAQRSKAFGFRLRFKEPPEELIVFRRKGDRLSGRGSGKVRIKTPRGRKRTTSLPFTVRL